MTETEALQMILARLEAYEAIGAYLDSIDRNQAIALEILHNICGRNPQSKCLQEVSHGSKTQC